MLESKTQINKEYNTVEEQTVTYGFVEKSESEKLIEDIFRTDEEKFHLFTQMLRRNSLLNKASITHKEQL